MLYDGGAAFLNDPINLSAHTTFTRSVLAVLGRLSHRERQGMPERYAKRRRDAWRAGGQARIAARYFRPVEPKPPSPRAVSSSESHASKTARTTGAMTSCAMRSPSEMV